MFSLRSLIQRLSGDVGSILTQWNDVLSIINGVLDAIMSQFEENIMKTTIMTISLCLFLVTVYSLKALPIVFSKRWNALGAIFC